MIYKDTIYVHYGDDKFDITKFDKIENNDIMPKPINGGLWASPDDSTNSWKIVYNLDEFESKINFKFKLKECTNILNITTSSDLINLPIVKKYGEVIFLDFEKISKLYDVIYFDNSQDNKLDKILPEWGCECIFVMNSDVIIL